MSTIFQLDTAKFDRVMNDYARLSRKTWPEIVNSKALDVAFRALKATPKASPEAIKAIAKEPWWPKYVAKRITGKGVKFKKGKGKINIQGKGYTRAEAAEVSRKIIAARVRSIAFLKSGWLPAVRRLWVLAKDRFFSGSPGGARQYGQAKGRVVPAVPGANPTAVIANSAAGIDKMGVDALQQAINGAAADMKEYIARKMEGNARRVAR